MSQRNETPFSTIADAQQYVALLAQAAAETKRDILNELTLNADRMSIERVQALRLVDYDLDKLQRHLMMTDRILADLRSLRRVLIEERAAAHHAPIHPGISTHHLDKAASISGPLQNLKKQIGGAVPASLC